MSTIQTRIANARTGVMITFACLSLLLALAPISAQQGKKYGKLNLNEYNAKTAEEKAIINTLMRYEDAFNAHDLNKFVSLFKKDGIYLPCGDEVSARPIASKECQDRLKFNFDLFKFETFYDPVISIDGNNATVNLLMETGDYLTDYTIWMQKVGNVWFISKNDHKNSRYKGY